MPMLRRLKPSLRRVSRCSREVTRGSTSMPISLRVEMEVLFRKCEKIFDLFGGQVGWRAAAPMELDHGAISRDAAADALHLLLQHVKIRRRDALVFLNDDVAGAKEAEAFAEGNVHVERDRRPGLLSLLVHPFEIGGAESVVP